MEEKSLFVGGFSAAVESVFFFDWVFNSSTGEGAMFPVVGVVLST